MPPSRCRGSPSPVPLLPEGVQSGAGAAGMTGAATYRECRGSAGASSSSNSASGSSSAPLRDILGDGLPASDSPTALILSSGAFDFSEWLDRGRYPVPASMSTEIDH